MKSRKGRHARSRSVQQTRATQFFPIYKTILERNCNSSYQHLNRWEFLKENASRIAGAAILLQVLDLAIDTAKPERIKHRSTRLPLSETEREWATAFCSANNKAEQSSQMNCTLPAWETDFECVAWQQSERISVLQRVLLFIKFFYTVKMSTGSLAVQNLVEIEYWRVSVTLKRLNQTLADSRKSSTWRDSLSVLDMIIECIIYFNKL